MLRVPVFSPLPHFHQAFWISVCLLSTRVGSPLFVFSVLVGQWQMVFWAFGECSEERFHSCWQRDPTIWDFRGIIDIKRYCQILRDWLKSPVSLGELKYYVGVWMMISSSFLCLSSCSSHSVNWPSNLFFNLSHLCFPNMTLFFLSHLQCAPFSVNIEPAPRTTSAATMSAWAAAWCPTQPVTAWPAAASSTRATVWNAAPKTTSPTRAGAASPSPSARTSTTDASGRRSAARASTATSTSSTTVPASLSVRPATRPSTPPRKWTLMPVWWALDGLMEQCVISEVGLIFCTHTCQDLILGLYLRDLLILLHECNFPKNPSNFITLLKIETVP